MRFRKQKVTKQETQQNTFRHGEHTIPVCLYNSKTYYTIFYTLYKTITTIRKLKFLIQNTTPPFKIPKRIHHLH